MIKLNLKGNFKFKGIGVFTEKRRKIKVLKQLGNDLFICGDRSVPEKVYTSPEGKTIAYAKIDNNGGIDDWIIGLIEVNSETFSPEIDYNSQFYAAGGNLKILQKTAGEIIVKEIPLTDKKGFENSFIYNGNGVYSQVWKDEENENKIYIKNNGEQINNEDQIQEYEGGGVRQIRLGSNLFNLTSKIDVFLSKISSKFYGLFYSLGKSEPVPFFRYPYHRINFVYSSFTKGWPEKMSHVADIQMYDIKVDEDTKMTTFKRKGSSWENILEIGGICGSPMVRISFISARKGWHGYQGSCPREIWAYSANVSLVDRYPSCRCKSGVMYDICNRYFDVIIQSGGINTGKALNEAMVGEDGFYVDGGNIKDGPLPGSKSTIDYQTFTYVGKDSRNFVVDDPTPGMTVQVQDLITQIENNKNATFLTLTVKPTKNPPWFPEYDRGVRNVEYDENGIYLSCSIPDVENFSNKGAGPDETEGPTNATFGEYKLYRIVCFFFSDNTEIAPVILTNKSKAVNRDEYSELIQKHGLTIKPDNKKVFVINEKQENIFINPSFLTSKKAFLDVSEWNLEIIKPEDFDFDKNYSHIKTVFQEEIFPIGDFDKIHSYSYA